MRKFDYCIAISVHCFTLFLCCELQAQSNQYFTSIAGGRAPSKTCVRAEVGVLGLVRQAPADQVLAIDGSTTPITSIFNANQLQSDMAFGLRTMVGFTQVFNKFRGVDFELGYFGIDDVESGVSLTGPEVLPVFFNSIPVDPPPTSNILLSSTLHSVEANTKFMTREWIRPIVGLRFFKLEDTFDTFSNESGTRVGGFSTTNNTMFGGQVGLEGDVRLGRYFSIYGIGKYGFLGNDAEGSATAADSTGANVVKHFSNDEFTSLIEAGTGLDYHFAGPLNFRVGYHFLSISEVATALAQNESIAILSPGPANAVLESQVWHGIDFSAIWVF